MDLNNILTGVKCSCGREHTCSIEKVYIERNAINRLDDICKSYNNILIVADENTYKAAGENVESVICDKIINKVIFPGSTILIPDEKAIEKVQDSIDGVQIIVGIGAGVIQDLCKYVANFAEIPYIIVATAPSMDGYASTGAAMILSGMKESVKSNLPKAIIADTEVLKNAPFEMIQAGYGDIIGKYSALCDWKLSNLINGEYFCEYIYDITYKMIEKTVALAEGIVKRDEESIKTLMDALVVVGIMMSFAGSSRPASGAEHHFSHFFEIVGIVKNEEYFTHGIDVVYSTYVAAKLRESILERKFPDKLFRLLEDEYKNKMSQIYGEVAQECIALQNKVGNYSANRIGIYKEKEAEIRKILAEMPSHKKIEQLINDVGLNMESYYKMYGEEKIKTAISYAKDLKDRYTVLWLYYDMFGEEI